KRPNWVSFSPSSCLILTPMMAKIVHTAKQTVKARVDIQSARPCPSTGAAVVIGMGVPRPVEQNCVVRQKPGLAANALSFVNITWHFCAASLHFFYWDRN